MQRQRLQDLVDAQIGQDAALRDLVLRVGAACADINGHVRRAALAGRLGAAGAVNVQGEDQQELDVLANDLMLDAHRDAADLAAMASEELDTIEPSLAGEGRFLLLFDPLDGSGNIAVNGPIGTIFSILPADQGRAQEAAFLKSGARQVAAGYAIYGPQACLVLSLGQGVQMFALDEATGDWFLTEASVTIPEETREFAINMSNLRHWEPPVQRYVEECLAGKTGPRGVDFNMRWAGSMVADVHRVFRRGGVFMYPRDRRDPKKPGKLRLLYEANPMSFLVEQAGGAATTGDQRMLDIAPDALHQRVGVVMGSRLEVERIAAYHAEAAATA